MTTEYENVLHYTDKENIPEDVTEEIITSSSPVPEYFSASHPHLSHLPQLPHPLNGWCPCKFI